MIDRNSIISLNSIENPKYYTPHRVHAYSRQPTVNGSGTTPKTTPNSTSTFPSDPLNHRRNFSERSSRRGFTRTGASSSMPRMIRSSTPIRPQQESSAFWTLPRKTSPSKSDSLSRSRNTNEPTSPPTWSGCCSSTAWSCQRVEDWGYDGYNGKRMRRTWYRSRLL